MTEQMTDLLFKPGAANAGQTVAVSREAWCALALLSAAMAVAYIDRFVLAMLIQPIKAELGFSDAQIGAITGLAFSAFYALFGLIIARIADKRGVRGVIVVSLVIWSLMTALCGAAQNFLHMLIARFGVGAGEAGLTPASHATLARIFPPERRNMALAVLSASGPAGIVIAMLSSGYLEQAVGWRWTFVIMAVPGLLLALVIVKNIGLLPAKTAGHPGGEPAAGAVDAIYSLLRNPLFVTLNATMALLIFLGLGIPQWIPAYFERSFGVSRGELGLMLALTQGLGMMVGGIVGGLTADWLMSRQRRWRNYFMVAAMSVAAPCLVSVFVVGTVQQALLLIGIGTFCAGLPTGALWASVQDAAPEQNRALGSALTMMVGFIIGSGIGPLLVGILSDLWEGELGDGSLGRSLLVCSATAALLLIVPLWRLVRHGGGK